MKTLSQINQDSRYSKYEREMADCRKCNPRNKKSAISEFCRRTGLGEDEALEYYNFVTLSLIE